MLKSASNDKDMVEEKFLDHPTLKQDFTTLNVKSQLQTPQ